MAADPFLVASGTLVVGLGVFHSALGERYIVRRLLHRQDLPALFGDDSFTRLTIRYAWHLLTIFCFAAGAILVYAATQPAPSQRVVVAILAAMLAACAAWGLVATRGRHLSWIVLLVAAALAAWRVA